MAPVLVAIEGQGVLRPNAGSCYNQRHCSALLRQARVRCYCCLLWADRKRKCKGDQGNPRDRARHRSQSSALLATELNGGRTWPGFRKAFTLALADILGRCVCCPLESRISRGIDCPGGLAALSASTTLSGLAWIVRSLMPASITATERKESRLRDKSSYTSRRFWKLLCAQVQRGCGRTRSRFLRHILRL